MKKYIPFLLLILVIIGVILVLSLGSCNTSKHVEVTKTVTDSNYIRKADSLSLEINKLSQSYEKLKTEAKKTGVVFKDVPCPDVKIDSTCNTDSLVKLVGQQQEYIKSLKNNIKVNADGSFELQGQIASFSIDLEKVEKEANSLYFENIKLKQSSDSLAVELHKAQLHREKTVKRNWLLFVIIGIIIGLMTEYKLKVVARILSLIKYWRN